MISRTRHLRSYPPLLAFLCILSAFASPAAAQTEDLERLREELAAIREQNAALQELVAQQALLMQQLEEKISEVERHNHAQDEGIAQIETQVLESQQPVLRLRPAQMENIVFSGEGAVAYFDHGHEGRFTNHEFRVDTANLYLDAKLQEDIYGFFEMFLFTREGSNEDMHIGEVYVDLEDVSRLWGGPRGLMTLRIGRFDLPFGEEYLYRDPLANPLISHSLADFWGIDEGIEIYGGLDKFTYVLAVQNGGHPTLRDHTSDKSIILRLGYSLTDNVHASVSAMRTGDISTQGDELSEMWFGNGFFRTIGDPASTSLFNVDIAQADLSIGWGRTQFRISAGALEYSDNDSTAINRRDVYFYSVEGVYSLTRAWYAAGRFSAIEAGSDGFPIVANGSFNQRLRGELTEDMWQLSLGIGYRWSDNLILKLEHSFLGGRLVGGQARNDENATAAQFAFGF